MADGGGSDSKVFFVYDNEAIQNADRDDIKTAIVYFYPLSYDDNAQCALCGQLMGMMGLFNDLTGSAPKLYKLQYAKFAVHCLGKFTVGLGGIVSDLDASLLKELDNIIRLLAFYHGSLEIVLALSGTQFLKVMQLIWDTYLPFIRHYGDNLSAAFGIISSLNLPKNGATIFLRSSNLLQVSQRVPGVIAGCILCKNKVLCTQLSPEITCRLRLVKPHQSHLPCQQIDSECKYSGLRLLSVYLTSDEYKMLCVDSKHVTKQPDVQNHTGRLSKPTRKGKGWSRKTIRHGSGSPKNDKNTLASSAASTPEITCDTSNKNSIEVSEHHGVCILSKEHIGNNSMTNIHSIIDGNKTVGTIEVHVSEQKRVSIPDQNHSISNDNEAMTNPECSLQEEITCTNDKVASYNEKEPIEKFNECVIQEKGLVETAYSDVKEINVRSDTEESVSEFKEHNGDLIPDDISDEKMCNVVVENHEINDIQSEVQSNTGESVSETKELSELNADLSPDERSEETVYSSANHDKHAQHNNRELSEELTSQIIKQNGDLNPNKYLSTNSSSNNEDVSVSEKEHTCIEDNPDTQNYGNKSQSTRQGSGAMQVSQSTAENNDEINTDSVTNRDDPSTSFLHQKEELSKFSVPGMKHVTLYVQGHSEMVLLLLMDKDSRDDMSAIQTVWNNALHELADIEAQVKECLGKTDTSQVTDGSYNYLLFDSYQQSLTGSALAPVTGIDNEFCEAACSLHEALQDDGLIDVTLRSHTTTIYGHRSASHETFYQPLTTRPAGGIPDPHDHTFLLDQRVTKKLNKDFGTMVI